MEGSQNSMESIVDSVEYSTSPVDNSEQISCDVVAHELEQLSLSQNDEVESRRRLMVKDGDCFTLNELVGFHKVPEQVVTQAKKRGFELNVLVMGESSCGKSTFIETAFRTSADELEKIYGEGSIELWRKTYIVEESSVRFRVTIIEAKGLGDAINNEKCYTPIVDYIQAQYDEYYKQETRTVRVLADLQDNRIHACVYMVNPTGHGLSPLDIEIMAEVAKHVNLIPVIAKADSMNRADVEFNKAKLLKSMKDSGIGYYTLPAEEELKHDEDGLALNRKLQAMFPFAVCGSRDVDENGNHVRRFPWGTVVAEMEEHSDLKAFKDAVICNNLTDIWKKTHAFYSKYRNEHAPNMGDSSARSTPVQENSDRHKLVELRDAESRQVAHKQQELREMFAARIRDKEKESQHKQQALETKYAAEMAQLEEQKRMYQEKIAALRNEEASNRPSPKFVKMRLKTNFFRSHTNQIHHGTA